MCVKRESRVRYICKKIIISQSFTLGKEERLKSRKLIERVFREGKSFSLFPFRVCYLSPVVVPGAGGEAAAGGTGDAEAAPGSSADANIAAGPHSPAVGHLQAGFSASSRNFKRAVDRNRIKRLTKEAYRLQKQALQDGLVAKGGSLAVFFIYTGKELPDYATVSEKIGVALSKLAKEIGV